MTQHVKARSMDAAWTLSLRLDSLARGMRTDNAPPYEERTVSLSEGELNMIVIALQMLSMMRRAVN